jgi:5-methylcytosine-specific restriction enzyme subunit McrC
VAVLAVREFERIRCGPAFDVEAREVTEAQHRALERFAETYKRKRGVDVFLHGPRRSLVAQNYVGVLSLGRHQVEILPKVESETSEVRSNLAQMIAAAFDLELHAAGSAAVRSRDGTVLELLIQMFCAELWRVLRQGLVRRYESRSDTLPVLRGRLVVSEQVRRNLARADRLCCAFDEFIENNHLNQAVRAALLVLQRLARTQQNQRTISELLFVFQDVETVPPERIRWNQLRPDRMSAGYLPILSMARLFIEGRSPDVVSGNGCGFAVLFDMNELFERYVGCQARRVLGRQGVMVHLQGPRKHLARHADGVPALELRPDIVVSDARGVRLIIDTKWKRLKEQTSREGVATADIYQMHAYAKRYGAPEVVMLYPHHSGLGSWAPRRAEYFLESDGREEPNSLVEPSCISVASLDLTDLATLRAQLHAMFSVRSTRLPSLVRAVD